MTKICQMLKSGIRAVCHKQERIKLFMPIKANLYNKVHAAKGSSRNRTNMFLKDL